MMCFNFYLIADACKVLTAIGIYHLYYISRPLCSGISLSTALPAAVASDLSCTRYSTNNGQYIYDCNFNIRAECDPNNSAAVECSKCTCI